MREIQDFDSVMIKLASPEQIKAWSYGEVKKPETINYRTLRPERDGLFCEKIFGTTKEWECYCGKFKSIRYKGVVCDRCGVEVTNVKVRRERMGHITLATPVSHIWYYRSVPSRMGYLLDLSKDQLSSVLYYEKYIVINAGDTDLQKMQLLTEEEYLKYRDEYGEAFEAGMGGEAIRTLLSSLDLDALSAELREQMKEKVRKGEKAENYKKLRKRIEIVESFRNNDKDFPNKPEWMILTVIPVIPPDLRPMVQLDGGRFATSDLNDLYRRVINRNNRLQRLMNLHAPDIIIRNEKRMLQEAVDALFDNSKRKHGAVKGANSRPLKSLSDMLKGKQGRFRQNLLGKRVDYSGRSVIVVGPELRIHQCGLPSKMALELFKPFLMRRLVQSNVAPNIKIAKTMIEQEKPEVWDILEQVVKEHPVMLNRAPTLHRLGIQAFEPVLVDGKAIKLHPLVCKAFNADFDGDQMAVHVPLSQAAQLECWTLMLSATNLLDPANGQPIVYPSQDMVLGINYLTREMNGAKGEGKYYDNLNEIFMAIDSGVLSYNAKIGYKMPDGTKFTYPKNAEDFTTPGRLIFADALPQVEGIGFKKDLNKCFGDKALKALIAGAMKSNPSSVVCKLADAIKDVGYKYATVFGATIGLSDMIVPEEKKPLMEEAEKKQAEILTRFEKGLITDEERKNLLIQLWSERSDRLGDELMKRLKESQNGFNPLFLMADSGARGSKTQIKQLGGMRGLMAKPNGDIIEFPIKSNFKEGLSIIEFFISTNGARKGLSDTALKTAEAGYLTRRLVDVSQDVVITEDDCGTINGIERTAVMNGEDIVTPLSERIRGLWTLEDVVDPNTGEILLARDNEITDEKAVEIEEAGVEKVLVRSVLTCEAHHGLCRKCYGRNLATNRPVEIGEAVGIIAAQSIGQPGTQLTMRTFHVGGTASTSAAADSLSLKNSVYISDIIGHNVLRKSDKATVFTKKGYIKYRPIKDEFVLTADSCLAEGIETGKKVKGETVLFKDKTGDKKANKQGGEVLIKKVGKEEKLFILGPEKTTEEIKAGSIICVKKDSIAEKGSTLVTFDPFAEPIVCEVEGVVRFKDIEEGRSLAIEKTASDEGVVEVYKIVDAYHLSLVMEKDRQEDITHKGNICSPTVEIADPKTGKVLASYRIPASSVIKVREFDENGEIMMAYPGQVLAERPKAGTKSQDITGGLPRVGELFEASKPKNPAVLAKVNGTVEIAGVDKGKQIIIVRDKFGKAHEHRIDLSKNIVVRDGDEVYAAECLSDGNENLHDILAILGEKKLQEFLLKEVQDVYRQQGVDINDKHLGIIVRQMLRKVKIYQVGDTNFIAGQEVDKATFAAENDRVTKEGGQSATAIPLLQGIKQASLSIGSFISAASFLETTKVLTNAAIVGSKDELQGLKENVIIGHLIPAGTGMKCYRDIRLPEEDDLTLGDRVAAVKEARQSEMEFGEKFEELMGAELEEESEDFDEREDSSDDN